MTGYEARAPDVEPALIFVKLLLHIDHVILPFTQPHEQCEREGAELANII